MNSALRYLGRKFIQLIAKLYRLFFVKDYYNYHHLELLFDNFKFSWHWTDHKTYTQEKELALKQTRPNLKPKEFIIHALSECEQCNFIIFGSSLNDDLFVQFWLGDGNIHFDFPMLPGNDLAQYKYQVLGLLAAMDFHRAHYHSKKVLRKKHRNGFLINKFEKGEKIQANFHHYRNEAAEFALTLIQDIFELDWKQVEIKVG